MSDIFEHRTCRLCGGELDTSYRCIKCDFDNTPIPVGTITMDHSIFETLDLPTWEMIDALNAEIKRLRAQIDDLQYDLDTFKERNTVLRAQIPDRPKGCICPPTSEKTCQSIMCPRKNYSTVSAASSVRETGS